MAIAASIVAAYVVGLLTTMLASAVIMSLAPGWITVGGGAKSYIAIAVTKAAFVALTAHTLTSAWPEQRFSIWLTTGIVALGLTFMAAVQAQVSGSAIGDEKRGGQAMSGFYVAAVVYALAYHFTS